MRYWPSVEHEKKEKPERAHLEVGLQEDWTCDQSTQNSQIVYTHLFQEILFTPKGRQNSERCKDSWKTETLPVCQYVWILFP